MVMPDHISCQIVEHASIHRCAVRNNVDAKTETISMAYQAACRGPSLLKRDCPRLTITSSVKTR